MTAAVGARTLGPIVVIVVIVALIVILSLRKRRDR
jgi:hypothetical protein